MSNINNNKYDANAEIVLVAHALAYAQCGWAVVPCHTMENGICTCREGARCGSPGKHPRTRHGLIDGTTDPDQIKQLWKKWPRSNIGIVTGEESRIAVLDIDPRHGGDSTLADLVAQHEPLPVTVQCQSGGGGSHHYFKYQSGIRNTTGQKTGLDVKSQGGMIMAPPSHHVSGSQYSWEPGMAPGEVEIAECPTWLIEELQPPKKPTPSLPVPQVPLTNGQYAQTALMNEVSAVENAPPGQQEPTLNTAAFNLGSLVVAGVLEEGEVIGRLVTAGLGMVNEPGRPSWSREQIEAKVLHGLEDGKKKPRTISPPTRLPVNTPPANSPSDTPKVHGIPGEQFVAPIGGQQQQTTQYTRQTVAYLRKNTKPTEWLVEPLLPTNGNMLIAGIPGIGKTWLVLLIALVVAIGQSLLNRFQTRQGAVLLVLEEEDSSAVLERLDMLYAGLGLSQEEGDALPIHVLIQQGVSLVTPERVLEPELLRHIEEVKPALVVLDPFRRVHGLDENDSGQMSALFNLLRQLQAEKECSLLLIHHLRKRSEHAEEALDRLRGSSDIAASVDSVLEVGGQFGHLVVKHSKSKRGKALGSFLIKSEEISGAMRFSFQDPDVAAEIDRKEIRKLILQALGDGSLNQSQLLKAGKEKGFGRDRIKNMCDELGKKGLLEQKDGPRGSKLFALVDLVVDAPAPPPASNSDSAEELGMIAELPVEEGVL